MGYLLLVIGLIGAVIGGVLGYFWGSFIFSGNQLKKCRQALLHANKRADTLLESLILQKEEVASLWRQANQLQRALREKNKQLETEGKIYEEDAAKLLDDMWAPLPPSGTFSCNVSKDPSTDDDPDSGVEG